MQRDGQGFFIAFEGLDGCGKTTQLKKTADWLCQEGISVLCTREPGGTEVGKNIRSILLDPANSNLVDQSELLLYLADRIQHLQECILPAKRAGKVVLCDRFHDATVAYQGYGRQLDLTGIHSIVQKWIAPHYPEITVLLEIAPEIAIRRIKQHGEIGDRLEQESALFFRRVSAGYRTLVEKMPDRFICVDATESIETIHQKIVSDLSKILKLKSSVS
ncbi:MAG: dTMP kinase [SAR324 cluster bacterium]|nr:dTMP kinase [SAR324 cluster bacterium]